MGTGLWAAQKASHTSWLLTMSRPKKDELNTQLKDYITQWRNERSKEEEELKRLKEKQAARKEIRAEQEKKAAEQKRAEELKLKREEEEKKEAEEQVEEEMKISLSIRIKPLPLESMDSDELKAKANSIWNTIVELETDKYDFEQRRVDQDYELKELNERRKLQLRNKAIKKGLDPEA